MSNAKKRGNAWEDEIELECTQLLLAGDARVVRAEDAFQVIGTLPNGRPSVVRKRRSEPDFYGVCDGGRHVAFDAKRTGNKTRFGLPDPRKPDAKWWHQVEKLTEVAAFGGIAFLYLLADDLENPFNRRRYVLPVRDGKIAGLDPRLDRSVKFRDAEAYRVQRRTDTWFDVVVNNLQWWNL